MRIVYPYNEILPKKRAHDLFIAHECAALADLGWDVTLLAGRRKILQSTHCARDSLFEHYNIAATNRLQISTYYLIRKNNPFGISWNLPFFINTQVALRQMQPDWVFLSVGKQGAYHLLNKIKGLRYLYEVHELAYYPNSCAINRSRLNFEKEMLMRADLISVTTHALKKILLHPPYGLKVPIEVIPLAVQAKSLPLLTRPTYPLQLVYVGQLYEEQGVSFLLKSLSQILRTREADRLAPHLTIVGGTTAEINHLSKIARSLGVAQSVNFLGYVPPVQIPMIIKQADAFIAPFEHRGRMPYVAHTKLLEYAEWGRPIIAPRLPIIEEHFKQGEGVLLFEPDHPSSLAESIQMLENPSIRLKLQETIMTYSGRFSWKMRAQRYAQLLATI